MIKIIKQTLYTQFVDDSTGEIFEETREFLDDLIKPKRKTSTRSKKESDTDPVAKLTLLEGKLQMNNAAVQMTGFEPEMKIDIKFEKKGRVTTPVMMQADSGNRLTKTYTISCRGSKHDNLSEYGDIFEVIPYEGKDGHFKLKGNVEKEDDIIDVPEEIVDPEKFNDDEDINEDVNDISDFDLDL
jgi:hypothetical protein